MSNFQNTEQSYSSSGVAGIWLTANPSFSTLRNSGGLANISGMCLVKAIYATKASGFTGASTSGVLLVAANGVSGSTSGGGITSPADILFYHYGGASGTGTDLAPILNLDFIARSGLSTYVANSGATYAYTLSVVYAKNQA